MDVLTTPGAKGAPAPKFGERVADILGQVLPHFHVFRQAALAEAKELAYKFVVAGASDPAVLRKVQDLGARASTYDTAINTLLADPNLPEEVGAWFKSHVG